MVGFCELYLIDGQFFLIHVIVDLVECLSSLVEAVKNMCYDYVCCLCLAMSNLRCTVYNSDLCFPSVLIYILAGTVPCFSEAVDTRLTFFA